MLVAAAGRIHITTAGGNFKEDVEVAGECVKLASG
jgi:hypothetical protein